MGYDELLLIGNREKRGGPTIASGAPAAALTMLQREEISGNLNFVVLYIYLFRVDGRRKKKGVAMFLYLYRGGGGGGDAYKYRRHLCRIDLLLRMRPMNKY
jgi:hypothetical protein